MLGLRGAPEGDNRSSAMDDFTDELGEIKREIVESRSLTIKTNNLVNALSADVNSIAKRQHGYERGLKWNSGVAYVTTAVVLLIAAKFVVDARVDAERARTKDGRSELTKLEKELGQLQSREEARGRTEARAFNYYNLVLEQKRREIIDQYPEIHKLELSKTERALFERAVDKARGELSLMAYQQGLDHIRAGRWHEAEQSLQESLTQKQDAAHTPQASYQLARALRTLGRQRDAIPILMKISEASPDKEVMDDAMFLLAECQVDIEAYNDAKSTLRAFIRRFPKSAAYNDARMKLADLQLHH
jgi:TolA-binding protein